MLSLTALAQPGIFHPGHLKELVQTLINQAYDAPAIITPILQMKKQAGGDAN